MTDDPIDIDRTDPDSPFPSEDHFLASIDRHFPAAHPHLLLGRGDDAAVLACPDRLAVSADLFIQDVHFRTAYFLPPDVGHKALAVNLSDMAAMGAAPLGFALQCFGPPDTPAGTWDGIFEGMGALARKFDTPLAGGDVTAGPVIGLAVTIWGREAVSGKPLTRTAQAGDILVVAGALGLARTGLLALEERGPAAKADYPIATAAHLRPMPRVEAGIRLAAIPGVRGAMDVSDGLARDLPRLLGNLGAELDLAPLVHPETRAWAGSHSLDPVAEVYKGGEDYALLLAVAPEAAGEALAAAPGARVIGSVTDAGPILVDGEPWTQAGFDHFGRKGA